MTDIRRDPDLMGPIDWVLIEWQDGRPDGAAVARHIGELVDRGIVRVLDIAFVARDAAGDIAALDLDHLGEDSPFAPLAGASTGLVTHADVVDAGTELEPGAAAALIVWENRWVVPLAGELRGSGGELVARGRIDYDDLLATLDALEAVAG